MATTKTFPWDITKSLDSDKRIAAYLEAVLEDGDPTLLAAALGDVARAKGMTEVARRTRLGRESLYKALSRDGNPELTTVLKVIRALDLKLKIQPVPKKQPRRRKAA
jgi:probable addiction module antidote protein